MIENKGDTNHLVGADGQVREALPDWIEDADSLARFVEFFVKKGYDVWPLPQKIKRKWCRPLLVGKMWLFGPSALKRNWQLFLMGRIKDEFAAHVKVVEETQIAKGDSVQGVLIVTRPIDMANLLRFFEDSGYIKRGARA